MEPRGIALLAGEEAGESKDASELGEKTLCCDSMGQLRFGGCDFAYGQNSTQQNGNPCREGTVC